MSRPPEYKVADNPHGIMFFGPGGPINKPDDGSEFTLSTTGGYIEHSNKNGNTTIRVPQRFDEICGDQLDGSQKENIAKSIVARNGDICIIADNGNIKLKAKNIFIETTGSKNNGTFQVKANGQITIATGDNIVISGTKLCLSGQAGVDIATSHMIKMLGVMSYGSPLSALPFLPSVFSDLVQGILESCK